MGCKIDVCHVSNEISWELPVGIHEKTRIAQKGKLLELILRRCHLFGCQQRLPDRKTRRCSRSRRIRRWCNCVSLFGVDSESVTDISSNVVGSVSCEQIDEGPGNGDWTDLTEVTGK